MAKSIEVDINVNNNIGGSIAQLKQLKRELKNAAVGSEEFKRLYNEIDDLEDKIKSAKNASSDWVDTLEMAGGPLGMLGGALNKAKVATQSWGAALKATGIGLIVLAVGGLVAAFTESEGAMKKLEPLFIGLEKILGGIMKVFEPLLDAFIELALKALPYIIKGVGGFYSGLFALFTLIKNVGMGAGKVLKGIFTLDWDSISSGYEQLTGSWNEAVKDFKETNKRFTEGSNELTKTEKANSKTRVNNREKEKTDKDKIIDSELEAMREFQGEYEAYLKKLSDLQAQYNTEIEDLQANTEQKKLDLWYKRKAAEIEAITKDAGEKNDLYALLEIERAFKQAEIEKKKEDDLLKIRTEGEDARTKLEQEQSDARKRYSKEESDAKRAHLQSYLNAASAVADALGKQTAEGKAIAIAVALISTYSAIAKQLEAFSGVPIPGYAIAEAIATGVVGFQQVAGIMSVDVPGGGGGGGVSSAAPQAPSFNVVGTSGVNQIAQTLGGNQAPVKAYVVSNDVTSAQSLDRNIISSASLG
jgi:hypothetical protein